MDMMLISAFNPLNFLRLYPERIAPYMLTYLVGMFFLIFRGDQNQMKVLVLMPLLLLESLLESASQTDNYADY